MFVFGLEHADVRAVDDEALALRRWLFLTGLALTFAPVALAQGPPGGGPQPGGGAAVTPIDGGASLLLL